MGMIDYKGRNAYLFYRLGTDTIPQGWTVSKRQTLPKGDFSITPYKWCNYTLWFVDEDNFTADERQAVFYEYMIKENAMIHEKESELAGKTVKLKEGFTHPQMKDIDVSKVEYRVEDWWDRVYGKSWMFAQGNPACIIYAVRTAEAKLPIDDEVLYGKIGAFGHLIHINEIETGNGEQEEDFGPGNAC